MNETKLEKFADSTMFTAAVVYIGSKYVILPIARKFKRTIDES